MVPRRIPTGLPGVARLIFALTSFRNGCKELLAKKDDAELARNEERAAKALAALSNASQNKLHAIAELTKARRELDRLFHESTDEIAALRAFAHSRFGRSGSELATLGIRPQPVPERVASKMAADRSVRASRPHPVGED